MKINSIEIKNFKSIEKLKIRFNKNFNLLIGKNNIGKTTIFEAILLWGKCYELNIQKSKPRRFYANSRNIVFSEVKSLRIYEEKDLFNKIKGKNTIEIIVEIEEENNLYKLGFKIKNLEQEKKTYLQVSYIEKDNFKNFEKLTEKYLKNLNELITISRSKPVANIARKEPYMYKDQIISKISKGKGIEVLRNKIISLGKAKDEVEKNISKIVGEEIHFIEEGSKKEYINLKIEKDGRKIDILSQGSGFLQLVEIFTTMEYKKGILNILLIDEPDAHLHAELQMKLVEAIKNNLGSQSFIISHNERFLNNIDEENIIFINKADKECGLIEPLKTGSKRLVLENLVDNISEIEDIQYIDKLVWLEGRGDINYIPKLCNKYIDVIGGNEKNIKFNELNGVDEINIKLPTIFRIYESFIKKETEWIILRDRDLIPMNRIDRAKREIGNCIYCKNKKVLFQQGYELYSTLFSEIDRLIKFIVEYYELEDIREGVEEKIKEILNSYMLDIFNPISNINANLNINFDRQKSERAGKVYEGIEFRDYLKSLESNKQNIELIMEKKLIDEFFELVDRLYNKQNKVKLDKEKLFDIYIENINSTEDIYACHLIFLKEIYM